VHDDIPVKVFAPENVSVVSSTVSDDEADEK
jgi:hypothetical protein